MTYEYKKRIFKEQQLLVKILKKNLNKFDRVYLHGISPAYYFLSKYNSPNYSILGYKYPAELSMLLILNNMSENDYIILDVDLFEKQTFKNYKLIEKFNVKIRN